MNEWVYSDIVLAIENKNYSESNTETLHFIDYYSSFKEKIYTDGTVKFFWDNLKGSINLETTYLPINLQGELHNPQNAQFYFLSYNKNVVKMKCLLIINLNEFFLPIYALKKSLDEININALGELTYSLNITKNAEYCSVEYIINCMILLSEKFGRIPEVFTFDFILKSNNLSEYYFHMLGIHWLTHDSALKHLLLSKGATPIEEPPLPNLQTVKSLKLSPFHSINFTSPPPGPSKPIEIKLTPLILLSSKTLLDKGRMYKELDIPFNFYQMIFK
jgi:hypothetical protein